MNNKPNTRLHYGYIIVLCCCLIMGFDVGISMSCAGIFYPPVSEALGVEIGTFSLYMSFSFLTSALMLSVAGKLLQKYSARWLLTLNSAALGIIIAAMGCLNEVWEFYIAGALMGVTLVLLLNFEGLSLKVSQVYTKGNLYSLPSGRGSPGLPSHPKKLSS